MDGDLFAKYFPGQLATGKEDGNNQRVAKIPLSRAEHRRGGRKKRADCLSGSEFPRAPSLLA